MKGSAAILTWCYHDTANFGQILQCYALQTVCEKYGLEVTVIKYRHPDENELLDEIPAKGKERRNYELAWRNEHLENQSCSQAKRFLSFIEEKIHLSDQCYSIEDVQEETADKDYLIVGSDQLWNPIWFDEIFLLGFAKAGQRCFSYATGGITTDEGTCCGIIKQIAAGIAHFSGVSVREPISAEILGKYTGKRIVDVLDPTLMLDTAEWDSVCGERLIEGDYILCFCIGLIQPQKHLLREIARKHGVEHVVYIRMNFSNERLNDNEFFKGMDAVGPKEFISLIKNAMAVCTDSFHGCTFSILYGRDFYLLSRAYCDENVASRIRTDNLLEKFEIGNRYVTARKDLLDMERIDYEKVRKNLSCWRRASAQYIMKEINEG